MGAEAISVRASVAGQGSLTQGQTLPVSISATNVSRGPVVMERVEVWLGHSSGDCNWRPRVYGSVSYDENADAYYLNEMAQMEAISANWTTGLLLPGETAGCTVPVEVLEAGALESGCKLEYYAGTFESMAATIYLERRRDAFDVTYERATPEGLKILAANEGNVPALRRVIHRPDSESLLLKVEAAVQVAPAALSPKEAMARAGIETERYAYSEKEGGWVLEEPGAVVLVTPEAVKRYPGCTLPVWKFVEAADDDVYFWYPVDDEALHSLFRPHDFMAAMGFHAHVPRNEAMGIVEQAHKAGYLSRMSDFQFIPCISFEPLTREQPG
jgi:hypothetical protein